MILTVRSEWTKLLSSNWCIVGIFIAMVLQPILLFIGFSANDILTPNIVLEQLLQALYISQVGIIIMSASFFGQEYFDSSLRTTFLANSSRTKVFVAKLSLLAAMSISTGLISSSLGIVVAMYHDVYFTSYVLYRAIFALFSWVMLGWISGFIAIILKSHVISMSIIIPLFLAVNQLLVAITRIFRFLPDAATRNVFTVYQNEAFLETRTGIAVQFIWVIVMGMFALWLYSHRDVK